MHIMGIPEEKEKRTESRFKAVIVENFLNLWREMNIQKHEAQRTPDRMNLNRTISPHILIKISKVEDKEF